MARKKKLKEEEFEVSTTKGTGTNRKVVSKRMNAATASQAVTQSQSDPTFSQSDEIVVRKKKNNIPQVPQVPQMPAGIREDVYPYSLMVSTSFRPLIEKTVAKGTTIKEVRGKLYVSIADQTSMGKFLKKLEESKEVGAKVIVNGIKESLKNG